MTGKTLVTAALIYANGPVHVGHLVEYIQTDIYTRFLRQKGFDAIYCCADDTHGTPIEVAALKAGLAPEAFIKTWYEKHKKDFAGFHIHFDSYYTTHSEENRYFTNLIFKSLKDNGHIYKKNLKQLYCNKCRRFLPDRFVKGACPKCGAEDQYGDVCEVCGSTYKPIDLKHPYCSICRTLPVLKDSDHYFFRLSAFSGKLKTWLEANEGLQEDIKNYVLSWIDRGLEDWCISRDSPYFGFKIPGEKDKYFYVWLDAPIGYIASTENYCRHRGCSAIGDYWKSRHSKIIHFIGKDIAYFHLIFWPAVLMGAGFKTPDNVIVHGFLTVNGEKMSKSRGTFLTAREYLERLDPEFLRYHYASNLTHTTGDIDLNFDDFRNRINNELIGNIANFCYRTLSFIAKNSKGRLGEIGRKNRDLITLERVNDLVRNAEKKYHKFAFREAVKCALEISDIGNRYFQENEPWKLAKEKDKERMEEVLATAANIVKRLATVLQPILPRFSERLAKQLSVKSLEEGNLHSYLENHKIGKPEIIFRKIEKIEFSDPFAALDLRVAKIEKIDDVPESDKLYVLHLDLGFEKRRIVAGLRDIYSKSDLKGKHIVVVCNLKKAKIKGIESDGMLLAADDGKDIGILLSKDKPGASVVIEGIEKKPKKEIDIKEFAKLGLRSKDGKAYYKDKALKTNSGEISVDRDVDGVVK
jgi:methionyl-tRNA synthetase